MKNIYELRTTDWLDSPEALSLLSQGNEFADSFSRPEIFKIVFSQLDRLRS